MTIASRVDAIIADKGETITLRKSAGVFNVATGENALTDTDYTVKASLREYSPRELVGLVQQGDKKARIAVAALSVTPAKGDKVIAGSRTFTVLAVDTRNFEGLGAIHILQIRGT